MNPERSDWFMAAGPGLEPGFGVPKTPVLPLDHPAMQLQALNPTSDSLIE